MTGVTFNLWSFGAEPYPCMIGKKIQSPAHFRGIIEGLSKYVLCDFGSTATLPTLERILQVPRNTLLVVASDGHPNSGGGTEETVAFMEGVTKQFTGADKILDVICIGAGSIQEQTGATSRGYRRDRDGPYQRVDSGGDGSECNRSFLFDMVGQSTGRGHYLPACTDYSELVKGTEDFFEGVEPTYAVVLPGGPTPYSASKKIQEAFDNGYAYFHTCEFGDYAVVKCDKGFYQMRIEEKSNPTPINESVTDEMNPTQLSYAKNDNILLMTNQDLFVMGNVMRYNSRASVLDAGGTIYRLYRNGTCSQYGISATADDLPRIQQVLLT